MLIQSIQPVYGHRIVVQYLWVKHFGCPPVIDNRQHMVMLLQALQQVLIYSHHIYCFWHCTESFFFFLDESMPGTPTSPTGSHTSMALSVSSSNTVPIARGEKHVVLAMSPARPKVSSMQSKLDHTKIDTSLYDQVLFDSNEFKCNQYGISLSLFETSIQFNKSKKKNDWLLVKIYRLNWNGIHRYLRTHVALSM